MLAPVVHLIFGSVRAVANPIPVLMSARTVALRGLIDRLIMEDCRTCKTFFDHAPGACPAPCASSSTISLSAPIAREMTSGQLWMLCLFLGSVGAFVGMFILIVVMTALQ